MDHGGIVYVSKGLKRSQSRPRPDKYQLTNYMLWQWEQGLGAFECTVERVCKVSRQFKVLLLVFAHGYMCSSRLYQ